MWDGPLWWPMLSRQAWISPAASRLPGEIQSFYAAWSNFGRGHLSLSLDLYCSLMAPMVHDATELAILTAEGAARSRAGSE